MNDKGCLIADTTQSKGYAKMKLGGSQFIAKRSDTIHNPINKKVQKEIQDGICKFPDKWSAPAYTVLAYVDGILPHDYTKIPADWVGSHLCHNGENGCVLALKDPNNTHVFFEPHKINMQRKNNKCGVSIPCSHCKNFTKIPCSGHEDSKTGIKYPLCRI